MVCVSTLVQRSALCITFVISMFRTSQCALNYEQNVDEICGFVANSRLRFNVLTEVMILNMFFWVQALCRLVGRSQHLRKMCCHNLQSLSDELGLRGTIYTG